MKKKFTYPSNTRILTPVFFLLAACLWLLVFVGLAIFGEGQWQSWIPLLIISPFLFLGMAWCIYTFVMASNWAEITDYTLTSRYLGATAHILYRDVVQVSQTPFYVLLITADSHLYLDKQMEQFAELYKILEQRVPPLMVSEKERVEAPLPRIIKTPVIQLLFLGFFIALFGGMTLVLVGGAILLAELASLFILGLGVFMGWVTYLIGKDFVLQYTVSCHFGPEQIVWRRLHRRDLFQVAQLRDVYIQHRRLRTKNGWQSNHSLVMEFENGRFLSLPDSYSNYSVFKFLDVVSFHYKQPRLPHRWQEDVSFHSFANGSQHEFGWYLTGKSEVPIHSLESVIAWLKTCTYVHDQKLFGKRDHWQHPLEFEKTKQGDCEDHALWAWRKLIELGLRTEFVVGIYKDQTNADISHAWVVYELEKQHYLLETTEKGAVMSYPLLSTQKKYLPLLGVDQNLRTFRYNPTS